MAPAVTNPSIELKKQDLETLLRQQLGSDLKIQSYTTKPLTEPGDNYGSTILDVVVTYQYGEDKTLHKIPVIAKLVQESPFLRELFNIGVTFVKEVNAYRLVSPAYEHLQKEKGIPGNEMLDIFPKFYGARTNQEGDINAEADVTAVLLLENLNISGYETRDRRKGLNLKHLELTISQLAQFHALSIALKILKPQIFKDTVLKACDKFIINKSNEEDHEKWVQAQIKFVKNITEIVPHLKKIETALRRRLEEQEESFATSPSEPFATLVHNDFWVNNMLFKYSTANVNIDKSSNIEAPIGMKFVDFQILLYSSPIRDLIFFLLTSGENGVIDENFEYLIHLYHQELINFLDRLDVDTKPFSFEHFSNELHINAPKEFGHIFFMLNVVSSDKNSANDTASFEQNDLFKNSGGEVYANKMKFFILTFIKKGWL